MAGLAQQAIDELRETVASLYQAFFAGLPRLVVGLVVFAFFYIAATATRRVLRPRLSRLRTPSFGRVFATVAYVAILFVGLLVTLPIAFKDLDPAGVLGGVSILALAAGFAFQDILTNMMAGILLVLREPFRGGDQIEVNDVKGTVKAITFRETQIVTFDGRLVLVPNRDVYTNKIEIQTHFDRVRTSLVTGVSYDTDLARARAVALEALAAVDGVLDDPPPEAYYTEHGDSAVLLDLRYWTASTEAAIRAVRDRTVAAVFDAFGEAGIDIPFPMVTVDAAPSFTAALGRGDTER